MDNELIKKLHLKQIEILDYIVDVCSKNNLVYFLIAGTLLGAVRHGGFIPWDDDIDIAMPRKDYNKFIDICEREKDGKFILHCGKVDKKYYLPYAKIRNKFTLFEEATDNNYNYNIGKGVCIDIFPLDNARKEKSLLQTIQAKTAKNLQRIRRLKNFPFIKRKRSLLKRIFCKLIFFIDSYTLLILQEKIMQLNKDDSSKYFVNLGSQYNYKKQTIEKKRYLPAKDIKFEGKIYKAPNDYDHILTRIYGDYMKLPPEEKRVTHNPLKIILDESELVYE